MKKMPIFLLLSLGIILGGITPSYAHGKGTPSPKHALRELREAQKILGKLSPDSDGHIAKASQSVDQAIQELSVIKIEPPKA